MRLGAVILTGLVLATTPAALRAQSADYTACTRDGDDPPLAARFDVCNRAVESGQLSGADLARALRVRGHALRFGHRFDDALRDFDRSLALQSDHSSAYLGRAAIRLDRGDHRGAFEDANAVVRYEPDGPQGYFLRGQASLQLGNWVQADIDLSHALELARTHPGNEAEMLMLRGFGRVQYGRPADALTDLDDSIRRKPDVAFAYRTRGLAHGALQAYEKAAADFSRAVALGASQDTLYSRGVALAYLGLPDRAFADFEAALRALPPGSAARLQVEAELRAYRNAVAAERARQKNQRYTGPLSLWRVVGSFGFPNQISAELVRPESEPAGRAGVVPWHALLVDPPPFATTDSRILRTREQLQANDTAAPMEALDTAIAAGASADLLVARADVWRQRAAVDAVLRDLERAVALQPDRADLYLRRGLAALRAGKAPFAVTSFDDALRRQPENAAARLNRAVAHTLAGDPRKARSDLDDLVKANVLPADALRVRGALRAQTGDTSGALADLTQALSLRPADSHALLLRGRAHLLVGDAVAALGDLRRIDATAVDARELVWAIGLAHFAAGEHGLAAARFASLQDTDTHAAILAHVAARRAGPVDDLLPMTPKFGSDHWPRPVRFLLGGYGSVDEVKKTAKASERSLRPGRLCEAAFYTAAWSGLVNRPADARRAWDTARKDCPTGDLFHGVALAEATRLR